MKYSIAMLALLAVGFVGCRKAPHRMSTATTQTDAGKTGEGTDDPGSEDPKKAGANLTCSVADGKAYKGFGNTDLVAGRVAEVPKEGDRYRVKPFTALNGEFTRVMGAAPPSLAANAATFAGAPDRWFVETQAGAVSLITSFRIAFEAGLTVAGTDAKYAAAPTEETATANCTAFARSAWNRLPSTEEVSACKNIALVETAAETDVKARWAYTMASVLTAAGFLAY